MQYVVVDFEWNQAMSSKSAIFNRLPIRLRGEIIQIGAVKLDKNLCPAEEFMTDIKPVYFKRMHYKVKKLTGIDKDRLKGGLPFNEAIESFLNWCGEDCVFLTWGYDDKAIMEQNLIIHDLDIDWMGKWINLQVIFNLQVEGDKNQKSLGFAMEHFEIEQTRVAHDALGDAYNTALVCSKLDLSSGMEQYDEATRILSTRVPKTTGENAPIPIEHLVFRDFVSREEGWADDAVVKFICPECGETLPHSRWVNQGDRRYMTLVTCPEHGSYLMRLRFRRCDEMSWSVNRVVYKASDEMIAFFHAKTKNTRHRRPNSPRRIK